MFEWSPSPRDLRTDEVAVPNTAVSAAISLIRQLSAGHRDQRQHKTGSRIAA